MTIADRLKGLRDYYNENIKPIMAAAPAAAPAPAPVVPAATEYTLIDGVTKVTIDKLEPGGVITPAPAAEGSITLQDGTVVTFDATGIITLVTAKAAETVEAPTEMKTAEQMRAFLSQFADDTAAANTSGMGAPDLNKLALVVKALFEDRFGWELRRAKEEADRASAIEIYKTGFAKQGEALNLAIDLISELSEKAPEPTEKQEKTWEEMTGLEKFRATKQK